MLQYFHNISPDWVLLAQLFICWAFLYIFYKRFSYNGIVTYIVIAIIASNLHVLKFSHVFYMDGPVAMGTIPFATTFLATDILVEFFGREKADKAVNIGLVAQICFHVLMLSAVAVQPLAPEAIEKYDVPDMHQQLTDLFTPSAAIVAASLSAYYVSEKLDVFLYALIKSQWAKSFLWVRSIVSTAISAFCDSFIFSFLAFWTFSTNPMTPETIFYSFVLGSFWPRLLIAILNTPMLYFLRINKKLL